MSLKQFIFFSLYFCISIFSSQSRAWGPEGHQTTGYIAQSLLTPETRVRLNQIMPGVDLGQVATWMDDERNLLKKSMPGSAQWHFYNMPVCDSKSKRDICTKGNCAVSKIDEYAQVLVSLNASNEDRVFALRVIVHVVGDLHQPLHAGDNNDRGGNKIKVGEHTNLHSEWDHSFVKKLAKGKSSKFLADELKTKYSDDIKGWQTGDPLSWATESNELARSIAYGKLPGFSCNETYLFVEKLPSSYIDDSQVIVEKRLAMGGARIAYVLNTSLTKPK